MNILVTGGFGFLGSHLIEDLDLGKDYLWVIDNLSNNVVSPGEFSRGKKLNYKTANLKDVLESEHPVKVKFDQIYHLASPVGPAGVLPHAGNISKSIISDTHAVAERALQDQARLVFVSTSELYGGGQSAEDDPKVISSVYSPRLEYAAAKLAAEISLLNMHKAKGLDVVIVRPFNIAGPRQSSAGGFVLPRFCGAALEGRPITVFGDGNQLRSFTHVKDVSYGVRMAMMKGQSGEVYNIGTEENSIRIGDLAARVVRHAKSSSKIEHVDPKELYGDLYEEANDKIPISTKAREQLGWQPLFDLNDIITHTLRYTKEQS